MPIVPANLRGAFSFLSSKNHEKRKIPKTTRATRQTPQVKSKNTIALRASMRENGEWISFVNNASDRVGAVPVVWKIPRTPLTPLVQGGASSYGHATET